MQKSVPFVALDGIAQIGQTFASTQYFRSTFYCVFIKSYWAEINEKMFIMLGINGLIRYVPRKTCAAILSSITFI